MERKKNLKVRKAMLDAGVTHAGLARILGTSQSAVSMALSLFEMSASEQNRIIKLIKESVSSGEE